MHPIKLNPHRTNLASLQVGDIATFLESPPFNRIYNKFQLLLKHDACELLISVSPRWILKYGRRACTPISYEGAAVGLQTTKGGPRNTLCVNHVAAS